MDRINEILLTLTQADANNARNIILDTLDTVCGKDATIEAIDSIMSDLANFDLTSKEFDQIEESVWDLV